jgi:hypothetical protein
MFMADLLFKLKHKNRLFCLSPFYCHVNVVSSTTKQMRFCISVSVLVTIKHRQYSVLGETIQSFRDEMRRIVTKY